MSIINLCDQRKTLINTAGHLLVQGGPGSGKTTISLIKAEHEIKNGCLKKGQSILFLSFARATVARVNEQAQGLLELEERKSIEVNTYHGFAWSLIKSYGYLLTGRKNCTLLPPPQAAAKVSKLSEKDREAELERLFYEDGLLGFDLFAKLAAEILERSNRIALLISSFYPIIIVDEFQDTDIHEWRIIKALGSQSTVIALADPEQRIYDFRGADPERIKEFQSSFSPKEFNFEGENNRSNGTDITKFGNDLLKGYVKGNKYADVIIKHYRPKKPLLLDTKAHVLKVVSRLNREMPDQNWSLAILTPTRKLMLQVSKILSEKIGTMPPITHEVLVDPTGPALSAVLIANLLDNDEFSKEKLLNDLINFLKGRENGKPAKNQLDVANALENNLKGIKLRGKNRISIFETAEEIIKRRSLIVLTGDPYQDWISIRDLLLDSGNDIWTLVGDDARYIRLLNKGTLLREELNLLWRKHGSYKGAGSLVNSALEREYFEKPRLSWNGIMVMTLHKSKGKEFDEVIIIEGSNSSRLIRDPSNKRSFNQSLYTLRVGVTRAKRKVTIITPYNNPCQIL